MCISVIFSNYQSINEPLNWTDSFQRKKYKYSINILRHIQHFEPPGKCELKLLWDSHRHQNGHQQENKQQPSWWGSGEKEPLLLVRMEICVQSSQRTRRLDLSWLNFITFVHITRLCPRPRYLHRWVEEKTVLTNTASFPTSADHHCCDTQVSLFMWEGAQAFDHQEAKSPGNVLQAGS